MAEATSKSVAEKPKEEALKPLTEKQLIDWKNRKARVAIGNDDKAGLRRVESSFLNRGKKLKDKENKTTTK